MALSLSSGLSLLAPSLLLPSRKDSEEPTNPTKPDEDSDEKDMCHYCIHNHCFPRVCKHNRCCQHEASQNASDTSVSALVNAALGQLKAGNTLKFNVNIKNPQAII